MKTESQLRLALEESLAAKHLAMKMGDRETAMVAVSSIDVLRWALGMDSIFGRVIMDGARQAARSLDANCN